jgi:bacterial microcompartment shell protein
LPVALGFIETDSSFGAVEASNIMAGIPGIVLLGKDVLSPGLITIKIIGDKEAVKAAINDGTEAVKNLGRPVSSHIIDEPDEQILSVLPEISSFYFFLKKN